MGRHHKPIRFVVAPRMSESVTLGLAWLDKWAPTIMWEDEYQKNHNWGWTTAPFPLTKELPPNKDPKPEAAATASDSPPGPPKSPNNTGTWLRCSAKRNAMPPHIEPQIVP
uniref:Uncharacterized protein n=1 Tax=Micrurus lemniscatus lemniscatus TaxID=129467 RepID=A0A2D4JGV2_MICLE